MPITILKGNTLVSLVDMTEAKTRKEFAKGSVFTIDEVGPNENTNSVVLFSTEELPGVMFGCDMIHLFEDRFPLSDDVILSWNNEEDHTKR